MTHRKDETHNVLWPVGVSMDESLSGTDLRDHDLEAAWVEVEAGEPPPPADVLMAVPRSHDPYERLKVLLRARRAIADGTAPALFLDWATSFLDDESSTCRWQALIVIGESIQVAPDQVWEVVQTYGRSADDDMRAGVATVLLEHLIENHPKRALAYLRAGIRSDQDLLRDTLATCWQCGTDDQTWADVRALVES